ncbi:hypothetical protein M408DRAFT_325543 [Serendipita vermifera MAFF 305830]|uniref:DUF6533 domain-containing protein n=1 Tax=Serendipita vermifera MAFF 305830 TaxID=933852 RepID=A0A0C3BPH7_SERVB|nr:hypothetical protein M408DRAFT_325543 [Serendipita vermifera MAFF 305830]
MVSPFSGRPSPPRPGESLDPTICLQLAKGATLNLNTSRYIMLAGLTIALYDIFLLSSDEIRLVWNSGSKMSVRLLYFFNHYVPPALLIIANYQMSPFRPPLSTNVCQTWIPFALCFQVISGICSSYILLLRVIALFGSRRGINLLVYTLFFFSYGICISAAIACIISMRGGMGYYIDFGGVCSFSGNQIWFIVVMTSPILFEICAGILTFYKAFRHAYALWNAAHFPLLHSLLRDGIFFCLTMVALRLCNAFIWAMLPSGSAYLGLYLLWAPLSVMTTRFYLNIKDVATCDPFSPEYSTMMGQMRRRAVVNSSQATTFARVPHSDFATPKSTKPGAYEETPTDTLRDSFEMAPTL